MNRKNKILAFVLVTVLVFAVMFWPKKAIAATEPAITPEIDDTTGGGETLPPVKEPVYAANQFPLKKGSSGLLVTYLQKAVNFYIETVRKQKAPLKVDGKFGPNTEKWVFEVFKVRQVSQALYDKIADMITSAKGSTYSGFIH